MARRKSARPKKKPKAARPKSTPREIKPSEFLKRRNQQAGKITNANKAERLRAYRPINRQGTRTHSRLSDADREAQRNKTARVRGHIHTASSRKRKAVSGADRDRHFYESYVPTRSKKGTSDRVHQKNRINERIDYLMKDKRRGRDGTRGTVTHNDYHRIHAKAHRLSSGKRTHYYYTK